MATIKLDGAGLTFRVRRQRQQPLKKVLLDRLTGRGRDAAISVHALQQISLSLKDGDRVSIIGHNGAGKSTLLRVLAGVYPLTAGSREIQGRVSSLFDLTLGFENDATGRENIFFRGYLLGETPTTLRAKLDSIIDFCELGEFIDTPIRYYSAGMRLRLAYAIATAIDPEILLIDECFSAGDLSFQQKAKERMQKLMDKARLIGMVTHDLAMVKELASRVIWLDHGRVRMDGPADEVVFAYSTYMQESLNIGVGGEVTKAA